MKKTKQKLFLLVAVVIIGKSPPAFAGIWDAHDSNAPVEKDASDDGPAPPPSQGDDGPAPPPSAPINNALPLLVVAGIAVSYYRLRSRKEVTKP